MSKEQTILKMANPVLSLYPSQQYNPVPDHYEERWDPSKFADLEEPNLKHKLQQYRQLLNDDKYIDELLKIVQYPVSYSVADYRVVVEELAPLWDPNQHDVYRHPLLHQIAHQAYTSVGFRNFTTAYEKFVGLQKRKFDPYGGTICTRFTWSNGSKEFASEPIYGMNMTPHEWFEGKE